MRPRTAFRRLPVVALAFLAPVLLCPTASAQSRPVKTVLTVHWSSEDFPTNLITDGAIRQVLLSRPGAPVDYYAEYLESDRFPEKETSVALRDYIRRKYRGRAIDLVIANSEPSLQFVLAHREELFPGAPVVFSSTTAPPSGSRRTGAGLTGVVIGVAYRDTLELALKLHPSTERVSRRRPIAQSTLSGPGAGRAPDSDAPCRARIPQRTVGTAADSRNQNGSSPQHRALHPLFRRESRQCRLPRRGCACHCRGFSSTGIRHSSLLCGSGNCRRCRSQPAGSRSPRRSIGAPDSGWCTHSGHRGRERPAGTHLRLAPAPPKGHRCVWSPRRIGHSVQGTHRVGAVPLVHPRRSLSPRFPGASHWRAAGSAHAPASC